MPEAIVTFDRVSFAYKSRHVLDDFSMNVLPGEHVCLFGPSGCGKTTALRLICGLEKPGTGTVSVRGRLRTVFQDDRLLPFRTVRENVALFSESRDPTTLAHRLGLEAVLDEYPGNLSGGMARRAALLRALAAPGDIYLLDEPFNGLDEDNTARAIELIQEQTAGRTLIYVLHDAEDARRLGCRFVQMQYHK